ncbi:response regulator, PATAN and FRGAF domain-containing [Syntrophotalea carbinolica DSM 2380]|uniref:Response regulator, PATAN and FRGAF domain-containing n=1 Tax=Syntrophotalea carbinolica (strain DSM 2380 / NBRC 103641 / GraBd1) TaxID=338963 RepID=Q3A4Q4_SYNC1|nr:response regulator [Syntrophotalea carbinolica]ABA88653.1 response regulator, PATAN and FRGAF domain-containing [Syntrophotalea carbinolica DSM 2380]
MSLVGQLADLSLDDILKIIHLSRKSGQLTVCGRDQQWTIAFWHGEVVRLSSEYVLPALIAELQRQSAVDPVVIDRAVAALSDDDAPCLATILVRRYGVSQDLVENVSRQVAHRFMQELTSWTEGAFSFDLCEDDGILPPPGENTHLLLGKGLMDGLQAQPGSPDRAADVSASAGNSGVFDEHGSKQTFTAPVWIVDDDPCLRQELGAYLTRRGMTVQLFETAADFWISLKKARMEGICPIAVIDLVMPRLDGVGMLGGLELLEKVCHAYPDMRVLPLSDHCCSDAESKVWALGLPEIFSKPQSSDMGEIGQSRAMDHFSQVMFAALNVVDAPVAILPEEGQQSASGQQKSLPETEASKPYRNSPGLHLLRGMLEELNNPALGGGIILLVLRFASEVMNRAVIFSVKEDNIVGLGQFGVTLQEGETDEAIRNIVIPRDGDSILSRLLGNPRPVRTRFGDGREDESLCVALGGEVPKEVFLGPIFSEGRVVAILYGDNLPDHTSVGNTEALEIFLSQAGMAMEKALLEGRLLGSHGG